MPRLYSNPSSSPGSFVSAQMKGQEGKGVDARCTEGGLPGMPDNPLILQRPRETRGGEGAPQAEVTEQAGHRPERSWVRGIPGPAAGRGPLLPGRVRGRAADHRLLEREGRGFSPLSQRVESQGPLHLGRAPAALSTPSGLSKQPRDWSLGAHISPVPSTSGARGQSFLFALTLPTGPGPVPRFRSCPGLVHPWVGWKE